jgi:hypothetical protein
MRSSLWAGAAMSLVLSLAGVALRPDVVRAAEPPNPQGAPCPGVVPATCSIEATITVRALGSVLRVETDTAHHGRRPAFSAECDGRPARAGHGGLGDVPAGAEKGAVRRS